MDLQAVTACIKNAGEFYCSWGGGLGGGRLWSHPKAFPLPPFSVVSFHAALSFLFPSPQPPSVLLFQLDGLCGV